MYFIKSRFILFSYFSYFLTLIILIFDLNCLGASDSQTVMDILCVRLEKLSNIVVDYEESIENTPSPERVLLTSEAISKLRKMNQNQNVKRVILTGTQTYSKGFSYLNGMSLYTKDFQEFKPNIELDKALSNNDTTMLSNDNSEVWVYSNNCVEFLQTLRSKNSETLNIGTIYNQHPLQDSYLELSLAMRVLGNMRLSFKDFEKMDITLIDNNVRLSSKNNVYTYEFVFSKELGYAPISYIQRNQEGQITIQMNMSDFKNVDGLMLPYKIEEKDFSYYESKQHQTRAISISVNNYNLDDPNNVPEKYHIDWPENTTVYDTRNGIRFTAVGGKLSNPSFEAIINEALDEDMDEVLSGTPSISRPSSSAEQADTEIQTSSEINKEDINSDNDLLAQTQSEHSPPVIIISLVGIGLITAAVFTFYIRKKRI